MNMRIFDELLIQAFTSLSQLEEALRDLDEALEDAYEPDTEEEDEGTRAVR